jgi:hypothetical protein
MQETPPLEVDAAGVTMRGLGRATTMVHSKVEPSDSAGDNKVEIAGKRGEERAATTVAEDTGAASSSIGSGDGGAPDTSNSVIARRARASYHRKSLSDISPSA